MIELLRFYFDQKNTGEALILYTMAEGLQTTGLLTRVQIYYEKDFEKKLLFWDSFQEAQEALVQQLTQLIEKNLFLDNSIVKDIGFHLNQYYKNPKRKNLVYKISQHGHSYWIGGQYALFGYGATNTWMYNETDENSIFELTPMYPKFIPALEEQEKQSVIYTQWMKTYKPYLIKKVSLNVVHKWLDQMNELHSLVTKISKALPCEGLQDCIGCIYLEKPSA
ncbi:hypothetical protein HYV11_01855 [Candidatus Dependentiae bacterium]|nr:hypothetical protein [Candidatus Dependentiae bacterium]